MALTASRIAEFVQSLDPERPRYLAVHRTLAALAERGEWPESGQTWRNLLAPILCSTPAEQQEFYDRFDAWLREGVPQAAHDRSESVVEEGSIRWWRLGAICPLLLAALLGIYLGKSASRRQTINPGTGDGATADSVTKDVRAGTTTSINGIALRWGGSPVDGAEFWYQGRYAKTGADGKFTLSVSGVSPVLLLATWTTYRPVIEMIDPRSTGALTILFSGPVSDSTQGWFWAHFQAVRWCAALVPAAMLLAWSIFIFLRRLGLRKWSTPLEPQLKKIAAGGAGSRLFRSSALRRIAPELRRLRPRDALDISADATVGATAARGGYFTPVFTMRHSTPEYLALGARVHPRDQQARFQDELFSGLRASGVFIDRYYFQTDPRVCRSARTRDGSLSIQDLAGLYPNHTLWLWCDAGKLLDPATDRPLPWIGSFQNWQDRTVFSPDEEHAPALTSLDFKVAQPDAHGVAWAAGVAVRKPNPDSYPPLLREIPERWLERATPPPALIARLSAELRQYLGDPGYRCLAACAVYPGLSWALTRRLAETLLHEDELEPVLSRIVRLPWFRYGTMPDWLRIKLIAGLSNASEVREALGRYLEETGARIRHGEEAVELARKTGEDGAGPLQDYVFLSFLWGRKLDPLEMRAPSGWRKLLFEQGRIGFGLRSEAAFALAALLGGAVWLGMGWAKTRFEPVIPAQISHLRPANLLAARALDFAEALYGTVQTGSPNFATRCYDDAYAVLGRRRDNFDTYTGEPGLAPVFEHDGANGIVENLKDGLFHVLGVQPPDFRVHEFVLPSTTSPAAFSDLGARVIDCKLDSAAGRVVCPGRSQPDTPVTRSTPKPPNPTDFSLRVLLRKHGDTNYVEAPAHLTVPVGSTVDGRAILSYAGSEAIDQVTLQERFQPGTSDWAVRWNPSYSRIDKGAPVVWDFDAGYLKPAPLNQPGEYRIQVIALQANGGPPPSTVSTLIRKSVSFTVQANTPLLGRREIPLDLGTLMAVPWARWKQDGGDINPLCNPPNPRESAFEAASANFALGMRLRTEGVGTACCSCTRRAISFPLVDPSITILGQPSGEVVDTSVTRLTGYFDAARGPNDPFSVASFRIDLFEGKALAGSAVFAAEHRQYNNCIPKPGTEVILKSGAAFNVPLATIAPQRHIDRIDLYMQGYACDKGTNSVMLTNLKLVVDPPPAAAR